METVKKYVLPLWLGGDEGESEGYSRKYFFKGWA